MIKRFEDTKVGRDIVVYTNGVSPSIAERVMYEIIERFKKTRRRFHRIDLGENDCVVSVISGIDGYYLQFSAI